METVAPDAGTRPAKGHALRHRVRTLHVMAAAEYKLKYSGSALGYVWSALKPLALFTMMYLVFGRVFKLGTISPYYAVGLLIGIVLFTFFADATLGGTYSLVSRESLLRKLVFPRTVIPTAATLTAAITFAVNTAVVALFIAWKGIAPRLDWLLIPLLLLELYVFVLGLSLILSALFVRFRDIAQVWELALQLIFYATPVIYPLSFLPPWAQSIEFVNPLTQVLQDIRALVFYDDPANVITATDALGPYGRLIPIAIVFATVAIGLLVFKHDEPWFAERV